MNWKSFVAALLIFVFGCCLSIMIGTHYYADIVFYFTATKQPVFVERVQIAQQVVGDPVQASKHHEVEAALLLRTQQGYQYTSASFSGSAEAAANYVTSLRTLEGRNVEMYLSLHAPSHHAVTLEFPLHRLSALALTLLLLVILPGLAIGDHLRRVFSGDKLQA